MPGRNSNCRDCSKCTERGLISTMKALANTVLIVCTLGISAVVAGFIRGSRKMCPVCNHPLSMHSMVGGRFKD